MGCFCAHQLSCGDESTTLPVQRYVGQCRQILRAGRNIVRFERRVTLASSGRHRNMPPNRVTPLKRVGLPHIEPSFGLMIAQSGKTPCLLPHGRSPHFKDVPTYRDLLRGLPARALQSGVSAATEKKPGLKTGAGGVSEGS